TQPDRRRSRLSAAVRGGGADAGVRGRKHVVRDCGEGAGGDGRAGLRRRVRVVDRGQGRPLAKRLDVAQGLVGLLAGLEGGQPVVELDLPLAGEVGLGLEFRVAVDGERIGVNLRGGRSGAGEAQKNDQGAHRKLLPRTLCQMGAKTLRRYSLRETLKRVSCSLGAFQSGLSSTAFW